ncbi:cGMP-dependent protein kinase, isozyme 1-like [Ctenocephalides felis]|uniref:cGMP-dependent protein kinase, isozyme 1-like n=1 Tax=Ctenocephalides felis TaxID=7515 RepID=UPI000E6E4E97|nr:cGMP-dependent protein kinase, isozyme 1-like [Ctenocephalides felis]
MTVSDFVQGEDDDDSDNSSIRPNRKAGVLSAPVDDEENLDNISLDYVEKDYKTRQLIEMAILNNDFLKNIMYDDRLERVISAMTSQHYDANSYVINEGEVGSNLYVSATGNFEVIKDGKVVKIFGPGVAFGELAILYKARRFASIRVTTPATVWTLERTMYSKIMIGTRRQEQEENVRFLYSVPLFQDVHPVEINRICDILKREFYQTGTAIVRQGEPGDKFYIIRGGSVEVTRRESDLEADAPAGILNRGDYFGEQALIHESVRLATVTALPPGTECLTLDRTAFIELLGNIKDLKEKTYPGAGAAAVVTANKIINKDYAHIRLNELEIIGTLGVGGFGRVELVSHPSTPDKTFALKCLQKVDIVQQQQQQHVYNEKHVMASCDSPFICRLYNTYKDTKYLYFLMEACLGGDVWTALHKAKCFDEKTSRFITACVIEAFEYLHDKNMIFRDLKPENLMLDTKGYIKLVDFGFAKRVDPGKKAWTFAGTPEYVAPEVIQNRGHDRAVDYWAVGILIHELLVGKPPFRGSDNMKTYHQILKGIDHVQMPGKVSRKAQELIRKLCRPAPAERLGYQKNGLQDVKNHSWYSSVSFDWVSLKSQEMPAPLVRTVENSTDMRNFDKFPKNREFPPDELSGFDINF